MKNFEVYNARYSATNKKECELLINLICELFGVFTDNSRLKVRFETIYNNETNRFKLYFWGTEKEYKMLCDRYYNIE